VKVTATLAESNASLLYIARFMTVAIIPVGTLKDAMCVCVCVRVCVCVCVGVCSRQIEGNRPRMNRALTAAHRCQV